MLLNHVSFERNDIYRNTNLTKKQRKIDKVTVTLTGGLVEVHYQLILLVNQVKVASVALDQTLEMVVIVQDVQDMNSAMVKNVTFRTGNVKVH